ncbi:hypothetical protein, partial [Actinoplanes philippinensis]|uniref:hypothetical protein n=1 Tax=Actinoplanes philippinensis TaxID=35752 RepID=UPI0033F65F4C
MRSLDRQLAGSTSAAVRDVHTALMDAYGATYTGRDPGGLATVETDGSGLVTGVRLVPTISRHPATVVAGAVRSAYAEAEALRLA